VKASLEIIKQYKQKNNMYRLSQIIKLKLQNNKNNAEIMDSLKVFAEFVDQLKFEEKPNYELLKREMSKCILLSHEMTDNPSFKFHNTDKTLNDRIEESTFDSTNVV